MDKIQGVIQGTRKKKKHPHYKAAVKLWLYDWIDHVKECPGQYFVLI